MGGSSTLKHLSSDDILAVYHFLLENTANGKLRYGAMKDAAENFGISYRTVIRIRNQTSSIDEPSEVSSALRKLSTKRERQRMTTSEIRERLEKVPNRDRRSLRKLAAASGISKSTLGRALQRGKLRKSSSDFYCWDCTGETDTETIEQASSSEDNNSSES